MNSLHKFYWKTINILTFKRRFFLKTLKKLFFWNDLYFVIKNYMLVNPVFNGDEAVWAKLLLNVSKRVGGTKPLNKSSFDILK